MTEQVIPQNLLTWEEATRIPLQIDFLLNVFFIYISNLVTNVILGILANISLLCYQNFLMTLNS